MAQAYLEHLYSKEAQQIAAKHYFRPQDSSVAAEFAKQFSNVKLVTVADAFGGWKAAQEKHFADGGVFDQLFAR